MIRTALFWIHLAAGVMAGAVILILSATGVLLTYEKQITHWADVRQFKASDASSSNQLTIDSLVVLAAAAHKGTAPTSVTIRDDPSEPAQFSFGREGTLFLDRATGAVLGAGSSSARGFFRAVEDWHRWLARDGDGRKTGRSITGAANLLFLLLVLTGMVLWLPRTWTWVRVRAVLWFRSGLSGKARDFNWHHVLGIWSALPLVVIVASGTVIGYPWASDLVFKIAGEAPPGRNGPDASRTSTKTTPPQPVSQAPYSDIVASSTRLMSDWKSLVLQIPKPGASTISLTLDRGTGAQPQHRAAVELNAATGAITKFQPFDSLSTGRQARGVLRFAHTGEVLGLGGQTLAGLVSLASVVLVMTGIALSVRRAAAALRRRSQNAAARRPATTAR